MRPFIKRITSRKFICAVGGFLVMLLVYLGKPESEAAQVASLVMAGMSLVGYMVGEGLADMGNGTITIDGGAGDLQGEEERRDG